MRRHHEEPRATTAAARSVRGFFAGVSFARSSAFYPQIREGGRRAHLSRGRRQDESRYGHRKPGGLAMDQRSVDAAAIEAEVGQIRSLGIDALRKRWRLMFGAVPSKGLTKDIIAPDDCLLRIQEEAFGGLDKELHSPGSWTDWLKARSRAS